MKLVDLKSPLFWVGDQVRILHPLYGFKTLYVIGISQDQYILSAPGQSGDPFEMAFVNLFNIPPFSKVLVNGLEAVSTVLSHGRIHNLRRGMEDTKNMPWYILSSRLIYYQLNTMDGTLARNIQGVVSWGPGPVEDVGMTKAKKQRKIII